MLLFLYIKDENGNKMVNQYVHLGKIGSGSYGKVVRYLIYILILNFPNRCINSIYFATEQVLYRNIKDGKLYAVKVVLSAILFCVGSIYVFLLYLFII